MAGRRTDTSAVETLVGKVVGGSYVLEQWLGKGGHGSVWRARHAETGGAVAIKLFGGEDLEDPTSARRFEAEAKHTHQLTHPNTVRAGDYGRTDDGGFFFAMEYVPGLTLRQVVKTEGALRAERVIRIASQVLKSLGEAHEQALVHRDIKPANIMLVDQFGERDFVKVLDFGIARNLEGEGMNTRDVLGTPQYMAPEQWMSLPVDGRTDLYSLGCVLYELLAGVPPFRREDIAGAPNPTIGMMNAHVSRAPRPVVERAPDAPMGLCRLVDRMLSKAPEARPQNAAEALAELHGEGAELTAMEAADTPKLRAGDVATETFPPGFAADHALPELDVTDPPTRRESEGIQGRRSPVPGPRGARRWAALLLGVMGIAALASVLAAESKDGEAPALSPFSVTPAATQLSTPGAESDGAGDVNRSQREGVVVDLHDVSSQGASGPQDAGVQDDETGAALATPAETDATSPSSPRRADETSDVRPDSDADSPKPVVDTDQPGAVAPPTASPQRRLKKRRRPGRKPRKSGPPKRKLPRLL